MNLSSVGIIGGADGPTAIFVTGPAWPGYVLPLFVAAGLLWWLLRRKNRK